MNVWKVDTKLWTVRAVEGGRYPATDSDGDTCFDNTHFPTEAQAWHRLKSEVTAFVSLAGRDVMTAQAALDSARERAAEAAAAFVRVQDQVRARAHGTTP